MFRVLGIYNFATIHNKVTTNVKQEKKFLVKVNFHQFDFSVSKSHKDNYRGLINFYGPHRLMSFMQWLQITLI